MNWTEILNKLFQLCIIPICGVATAYIVAFIKSKTKEVEQSIENETAHKYLDMAEKIICDVVIATNQTYVDALKDKNAFDAAAQVEAFQKTKTAVMALITDNMKKVINEATGDFDVWVDILIEAKVKEVK